MAGTQSKAPATKKPQGGQSNPSRVPSASNQTRPNTNQKQTNVVQQQKKPNPQTTPKSNTNTSTPIDDDAEGYKQLENEIIDEPPIQLVGKLSL